MSDVQSVYTPSQIQEEDKILAGKDRRYSFTAVNPMNKDHKDPQEFDLTKPRLALYKQKVEKAPGYGVFGRYTACPTERIEVLSNKIERNHPLCKYHTSNDVFSRCKSVHKMARGKSDDQSIQPDNKLELGTSYKLNLGPR